MAERDPQIMPCGHGIIFQLLKSGAIAPVSVHYTLTKQKVNHFLWNRLPLHLVEKIRKWKDR
jgi:hypothetical protein